MIIGENTVAMDPVKVQAVTEWPIPLCKRDVQVFLGFTNFYRRFIKNYAKMAKPLSKLTGNEEWEWTPEQQKGFDSLIDAFATGPVLAMAIDDGKYKTEIDASGFACGGVLMQQQNKFWRTITFRSSTMNEAERNYGIEDREMLAIITALRDWRRYLLGAKEPFEIWTDHANLQYFKEPHKVNRRLARWFSDMADYHFTIHHLPGNKNCRADALSRRPDYNQGEEDNQDVILLPEALFRALLEEGSGETLLNQIAKVQRRNQALKQLRKGKEWTLKDSIVRRLGKVFIPNNEELKEEILWTHHDAPLAGHPGRFRTQELINREYWWPNITKDVRSYVEGCETCQRTKIHCIKSKAPLYPTDIATEPWETISVDIVGPLPESRGYNVILVITKYLTKMKILVPCITKITSSGVAVIFC